MLIRAAHVCDFAEIREGLLFVMAAGITRIMRPQYPAALGLCLALTFEIPPQDRAFPQEFEVTVVGPDGATVGQIKGAVQVAPGSPLEADEVGLAQIAVDLRQAEIKLAGWHTIQLSVNNAPSSPLKFKAVQSSPPVAGPVPLPVAGTSKRPH